MAKRIQFRGGTTAQHNVFTGAIREITVDTDKDTLVVHDGSTVGGFTLARESSVSAHTNRTDNPHSVTKTQVGLSNVDNTADSIKVVASAGKLNTARNITLGGDVTGTVSFDGSADVTVVAAIAANSVALGADTTGNYVAGVTAGTGITVGGTAGEGWTPSVAITNVGTAGTYTKVTTNAQGQVTNGATLSAGDIPSLDASKITSGVIDAARLPAYVDDVLEFANLVGFPVVGNTGKIYVALDTNKAYRWSGSAYIYITSGAVDSVAGKTGVVTLVKADVGLSNVDNTSDVNKPISTATSTALNSKQNTLVSGTNIKTVNSESVLGSGNIVIPVTTINNTLISTSTTEALSANMGKTLQDTKQATLVSGTNIKTINGATLLGAGDLSTIQTTITGNSGTATKLQTARTINGVSFDGSANISVGLGNQGGAFSTPFTLDNTYKNRLLVCDNGITITLPTINTIKSGDLFYITNSGLEPLTLALNGNSTNLSTQKVTRGETLVIQSDGGSFYRCISRGATPVYDFDTNLITLLSYNTVFRADKDLTLVVICSGNFMNGIEIVTGTSTSPTRVVGRAGDDINSNTKWATLTAVIPAGLYFKVQGFGVYPFEEIEIMAYKHR